MEPNEPVRHNRRTVLKVIGACCGTLIAFVSTVGADGDEDPDDGWAWETEDGDEADPEEGWAWSDGNGRVAESAEGATSMTDGDDTDPNDGWAW